MDDSKPKHASKPVVAIAGVGSGLGASLARRFASGECRVALLARSIEFSERLARQLDESHGAGTALAVSCDLAAAASIADAFAAIRDKLGPIHILINHASSAGGPRGGGLLELDPAAFEKAWRVGVMGALLCSREAVPDMLAVSGKDAPFPSILFTGATSSVRGSGISFSSAKFASRGLAQSLARELWPQGVHVAHIIIDGVIRDSSEEPYSDDEPLLDPDAMAETYWQLASQPRTSWTLELDLRPHRELFFD